MSSSLSRGPPSSHVKQVHSHLCENQFLNAGNIDRTLTRRGSQPCPPGFQCIIYHSIALLEYRKNLEGFEVLAIWSGDMGDTWPGTS